MKKILQLFFVSALFPFVPASMPAATTNSVQVSAELLDGSRLVGKCSDAKFRFHSDVLGEIILPLDKVGSVECQTKTNLVKLVTSNGDVMTVSFDMPEIHIETSFGSVKVPVGSIRRLQNSPSRTSGRPRRGLVALWSGEGNYVDAVNGNTAVPVGAVSFAEGRKGRCFLLNSAGAYLRIPANAYSDVGKGDGFTIEGWICPATVMPHMPVAEFTGNPGTLACGVQLWISIGVGPGCFYANVVDSEGGTHSMTSASGLVLPNVWQHVALTYDKTSGRGAIYLNGSEVLARNLGSFTPRTDLDLLLGARILFSSSLDPSDMFSGKLDEFGIYDHALSATEIRFIYGEAASPASDTR